MALSLKELRARMVPDSAKKDSGIDSQYLKPASFDKKAKKEMVGDPETIDIEDIQNSSDAFKAQNLVKKNTKAPLREDEAVEGASSTASLNSVNLAYEDESLETMEEILQIIDEFNIDGYCWKEVSKNLKAARDILLQHHIVTESVENNEDFLAETAFKTGNLKLKDGTTFKLSRKDAAVLNQAVLSSDNQKRVISKVTKTKNDLVDFLEFARNLDEDMESTIEDLLSEGTEEQLNYIIENELSESESWNLIKKSTRLGYASGKLIGGAYGAAAGAGFATAIIGAKKGAKLARLVNKWNKDIKKKKAEGKRQITQLKKEVTQIPKLSEDEGNNDSESILGTSAPAIDSDKKKKNDKDNLQEVSKDRLGRYIVKAADDKANIRSIQAVIAQAHPNQSKDDPINVKHKRMINNRDTGIRRAINSLKNKKVNEEALHEAGGLGGHPSNYRNPAERNPTFAKTEPAKKLDYYVITPHDVIGKAPRKEGDVFTVRVDRNMTTQMKLLKTVDNRFYGVPLKEEAESLQEISQRLNKLIKR